ncbi:MAG: transposase [Actinobacteria bacterium]|nr:transposase [Actinomycetota bacterium]
MIAMTDSLEKTHSSASFPCHCCHKKATVSWSEKRNGFICSNCLKTFDRAVIAARNDMTTEQLTLC